MNPKTLKALKQSIAHWKQMRECRDTEEPIGDNCPLCERFRNGPDCIYGTERCPVSKKTGLSFCKDTPYPEAYFAFYRGTDDQWKTAATAEIKFLQSLLPKTKAKK